MGQATSPYLRARRTTYELLFESGTPLARAIDVFVSLLIVANVVVVVAESVTSVAAAWAPEFRAFEVFSVTVFTVEYLGRAWSAVDGPAYSGRLGRLRYLTSFGALVDLIAILPFYVPELIPLDTRFVRALRLLRLARMFKLGRRSESLDLYAKVFRAKRGDLAVTLAALCLLLVVAASLMYFVEGEAQPDKFSSIPEALWWGIITMTTIGYGDVYPITLVGKVVGGLVALFGVAFFALPPAILVAGIMEELQRQHRAESAAPTTCPHCGKQIPPAA